MPLLFRHDGERELRSVRRPNRPEAIVARNIFYNRNLPARHICDGYAALGTGILRITFGVERDARAVGEISGNAPAAIFFACLPSRSATKTFSPRSYAIFRCAASLSAEVRSKRRWRA